MTQSIKLLLIAGCSILFGLFGVSLYANESAENVDKLSQIIDQIEILEGGNEPKCYATASRLEDFMFGTPLSDEARFRKNQLQKAWLLSIWNKASSLAIKQGKTDIDGLQVKLAGQTMFNYRRKDDGHWLIKLADDQMLTLHKDDKRQYGSIAYSLRTLLAVQQESLLDLSDNKLPLNQAAINALTEMLDLYTLSVLKMADHQARSENSFVIGQVQLSNLWLALMDKPQDKTVAKVTRQAKSPSQPIELAVLRSIIKQKVRSYAAYNKISNQLFVRNLQVYFSRNRWPADPEVATAFRRLFTETLIAFAGDFFQGAEQIALAKGHRVITEADISEFAQRIIPHKINQYEDAIFFPKLVANEQVIIESYDMDAFRDSGVHWRYLEYAISTPTFKAYLEPDPFAAELLVENIAQFGVLVLRMIGDVGRELGDKRINLAHFEQAMAVLQSRVNQNAQRKSMVSAPLPERLHSTKAEAVYATNERFFTDITAASGIDFMHRTSDWLNRLLRGYLSHGDGSGNITIPPAFGGAGIAAEDVNNDGLADLLILSGLGNRLYINRNHGKFEDVTQSAGLTWSRPSDKRPGEPRQPLIADLDNDGLQDIVITYVDDSHRVYKNLGNEKFADMTSVSQLGGPKAVAGPATVFDFDNDGLLDIYIGYFGDYIHGILPTLKRRNSNGLPNQLFRNIGGFKFKEVTEGSGLDNTGWGQALVHTDFDGDGWQDVIVGNDFGVNAYYKNLGNGKFEDMAKIIGTDKPSYTMGIGTADLNDDFIPDIYISNIVTMNKDEKYVLPDASTTMKFNPNKLAQMRVIEANDLFLSTKQAGAPLSYQPSQLVGRGYSSTGWSWDADFFDFDNDADDDLYVLNGMNEFNLYSNNNSYYTEPLEDKPVDVYIPVASKESNVFFVNQEGRLDNHSKQSGADLTGNSRSATYLDIDSDGDLDMVLNNYHDSAVVYRNNTEKLGRHWLKVKLVGAPKQGINLDAIGAQIIVTTKDADHIWRQVQGSTGYLSVHPKVQHFGLGNHKRVNILVKWPNGKRTSLNDITANQTLVIKFDAVKTL